MKRKISVYIRKDYVEDEYLKIPIIGKKGTKYVNIEELLNVQKMAKKANVEITIKICPHDEVCEAFCFLNPDIIIFDEESHIGMSVPLQDVFHHFQEDKTYNQRDFSEIIKKTVQKDFNDIIHSVVNN